MTRTAAPTATATPSRTAAPGRRAGADPDVLGRRLLASSARHSFDPVHDLDWEAPLVPGLGGLPLHRVSLWGTPTWDALTAEQRTTLSLHEFASTMQVGLWFELILMQMLLRYAYDRDPGSAHVQYALTEVGDETRHCVMFARAADRIAGTRYRPSRTVHELGRLFKTTGHGPSMLAGVLVAEETLDRLQRELLDDETVQPLVRAVSRIHVVEEARHVSYARQLLTRQVATLSRAQLHWHRTVAAVVAQRIVEAFLDPAVYASVGLDPRQAQAVARANPHHRETRRWMGEKVTAFLTEQDMIGGPTTVLWRRTSLVA